MNELLVADGIVDLDTVRVSVWWRKPEEDTWLDAAVKELSSHRLLRIGGPDSLRALELVDGRGTLIPKYWQESRFGDGPTFAEMCRHDYGRFLTTDGTLRSVEQARSLVRNYQPDFGSYPARDQADFLRRTLKKMIAALNALEGLRNHLEFAGPAKDKAVAPIKKPERDVHAAVLSEIHEWKTRQIGEELKFGDRSQGVRYYDQTVGIAISRGLFLLGQAFGTEGWELKKQRMKAMRGWRARCAEVLRTVEDEKEQIYRLLAEVRGTTVDHQRMLAIADGFDAKLGPYLAAMERDDFDSAFEIIGEDTRPEEVMHAITRVLPLL